MTSDLERAVKAIHPYLAWNHLTPGYGADAVRAVLLAVREPSEAMLEAAYHAASDEDADIWRAMIDSILGKEQP